MFTSTQKTAAATKIDVFVYFSCFVKYSNAGFNGVPHDQLASVSAQLSSAQLILLHVPTARRRVYRWTLQAGAATAIAMPTANQTALQSWSRAALNSLFSSPHEKV